MRDSLICPKCKTYEILLIDRVPDAADGDALQPQFVAVSRSGERYGRLTAAVCRNCGYTELYTVQPRYIPVDGKRIRLETGPRPTPSPYRG